MPFLQHALDVRKKSQPCESDQLAVLAPSHGCNRENYLEEPMSLMVMSDEPESQPCESHQSVVLVPSHGFNKESCLEEPMSLTVMSDEPNGSPSSEDGGSYGVGTRGRTITVTFVKIMCTVLLPIIIIGY